MQGISKEEFLDWLSIPATQTARKRILQMVREEEYNIGVGSTVSLDSADLTHGKTNRSIGKISGFNKILDEIFPNMLTEPEST